MALTGKQIRQLRGLAHHLSPAVIIGKAGVNDGAVAQAREHLDAHELVKCSVLDAAGQPTHDVACELADRLGAQIVQVIGRRFSLFRKSERDDIEHIALV